jgi:hypothetical protein
MATVQAAITVNTAIAPAPLPYPQQQEQDPDDDLGPRRPRGRTAGVAKTSASAVKIPTATMIPRIQPMRNPLPVLAALAEKSIRIGAMMSTGDIATPNA